MKWTRMNINIILLLFKVVDNSTANDNDISQIAPIQLPLIHYRDQIIHALGY